jgi:hypothetical protein
VATVIEGDFEWDDEKARSNFENHGVSFPEAATVFADPAAVYTAPGLTGWSSLGPPCATEVVHVERGRRDRIISARPASRAERDVYESGENP